MTGPVGTVERTVRVTLIVCASSAYSMSEALIPVTEYVTLVNGTRSTPRKVSVAVLPCARGPPSTELSRAVCLPANKECPVS